MPLQPCENRAAAPHNLGSIIPFLWSNLHTLFAMKTLLIVTFTCWGFQSLLANTNSAIAQFDTLLSKKVEIASREHTDEELEPVIRGLVSIAYEDLMERSESVFEKGMDSRWAERLEALPAGPFEAKLRDESVPVFAKQVMIFGDGFEPNLGAHLLQRCWISRTLAVKCTKTKDLQAALQRIKESNSYLNLIEEYFQDQIAKSKNSQILKETRTKNETFLSAVEDMVRSRQTAASESMRKDGKPSNPVKLEPAKSSVKKTFRVTYDERANQNGIQAGADGESTITVQGDDGSFSVHYRYSWPSSILIVAKSDKSLVGKTVSIEFVGEKPAYISCDSGTGRCTILSFSKE